MSNMNADPVYHITFVRHGESTGNAQNRFQGQSDYPLSETGRAQASALAERWKAEGMTFDRAISSPLSRARQTADILAAALGNFPVEDDPLWMERDNGKRSGLTWEEVQALYPDPDFYNPYESVGETGEGDWALYLRAGQALHKILQRPPARYLVATHGAILNMALYAILGIPPQPNYQGPRFRLENTSVCAFRYHPNVHRWRVDVIGDTGHLKE
ncbi:MAG: histidine phosphatase family protein [Chloroflexi bacterium]|nr:MAG: histidine phosphatase family protein [Chloroflexota bacterium]